MAFVDTFGFDPDSDGNIVYSRYARFDLDLSRTLPGSEWHLGAITVPSPDAALDNRLKPAASVIVRRLQGRRLLYTIGQYAGGYRLYAFDTVHGNLAQEVDSISGNDQWAWNVDSSGGIWHGDAPGRVIRFFRFQGWTPAAM